jgi:hypothetical protein
MTADKFRCFRAITKFQNQAGPQLLAESKFLNHGLISIGTVGLEVVEQATPLAHQHKKAAARTVVFLVRFEVLRQLTDTLA